MTKEETIIDEILDETEPVETQEEDIEILDTFDLTPLIVDGTQAEIERFIEFPNEQTGKLQRMPIYIRPVSHGVWDQAARNAMRKGRQKNIEELICSQGWFDGNGKVIPITTIRKVKKGIVTAVYEEIKIVSGQTTDRFEDKYLEKLIGDF